jgi:2-haloacid dehalogenase
MQGLKVLAFDIGGTILDWHGGVVAALAECGARRGVEHDWHGFANEYRRRSLKRMLGAVEPSYNIDDVHRDVLDELLGEAALDVFSREDRRTVTQRWHDLQAWPDFVPALTRLRQRYVCASFTILSLSLVIDVSRRNGIGWDAVIPCEMLRVYKTQPAAYQLAAKFLGVQPAEILMVACHNFDLDAARGEGYRTAFVRRPDEWGLSGSPDPVPTPAADLAIAGFDELAKRLDV